MRQLPLRWYKLILRLQQIQRLWVIQFDLIKRGSSLYSLRNDGWLIFGKIGILGNSFLYILSLLFLFGLLNLLVNLLRVDSSLLEVKTLLMFQILVLLGLFYTSACTLIVFKGDHIPHESVQTCALVSWDYFLIALNSRLRTHSLASGFLVSFAVTFLFMIGWVGACLVEILVWSNDLKITYSTVHLFDCLIQVELIVLAKLGLFSLIGAGFIENARLLSAVKVN